MDSFSIERDQPAPKLFFWACLTSIAMHSLLLTIQIETPENSPTAEPMLGGNAHYRAKLRRPSEITASRSESGTTMPPLQAPANVAPATQTPQEIQDVLPQTKPTQALPLETPKANQKPPGTPSHSHGTVFSPGLRQKLHSRYSDSDSPKLGGRNGQIYKDAVGRTVLKQGRFCSTFNEGVDETDPGLWTLPYECDPGASESQRIKNAISNALREYRGKR